MLPHGFHFFERGWLSSNSLLIQDTDQSVLFDSGYVTHSDQLLTLLDHTLHSHALDSLVNTHLHSDHCGGNSALQIKFPNLRIHIAESQFQDAFSWDDSTLTFIETGQSCPRFTPTNAVKSDSISNFCNTQWQSFQSPGHDNDSMVFFEPHLRILISADALWEKGLGVIFPEFLGGEGFENVAKTYDLIESLQPRLVIPGHGPMFTEVAKALADGRRKLAAFNQSPVNHAIYAAKVLIKFKLMELQKVDAAFFTTLCTKSPLLVKIHEVYFAQIDISLWIQDLFQLLADRGALIISDGCLLNQ